MKYISKLMGERTSMDGVVLITLCGSFLLLGGLAEIVAWAGLAYGAWTVLTPES
tara:strand:- start:342 stop:503 length:162 start_codon:yes stop_codon:yes gene_type:complete